MTYKHTQPAIVIWVLIGAVILLVAGFGLNSESLMAVFWTAGILAVVLYLFHALTVEIREEDLRFWFGPGLIGKKIPLQRIEGCKSVIHPWYLAVLYGWGIRYIGRCWMYNVSGCKTVELQLAGGKRLQIGTDEPERLVEAIEGARTGCTPSSH